MSKFRVLHWKTHDVVDEVAIDDCFDWYYTGVPVYINDRGYAFVYAKDMRNQSMKDLVYSNGKADDVHRINYYIETGKRSVEKISAIHHKNGNKLDCRIHNLEIKQWGHEDHKYSHSQHNYREIITEMWRNG